MLRVMQVKKSDNGGGEVGRVKGGDDVARNKEDVQLIK